MDELQEHVHTRASVGSVCYGIVIGAFQLVEAIVESVGEEWAWFPPRYT
jgi:hypothetical protein